MEGLIDLRDYPEIYADGIARAQMLIGGNVRLFLYTWWMTEGIMQKRVVATVTRPVATLLPEQMAIYRVQGIIVPNATPDAPMLH